METKEIIEKLRLCAEKIGCYRHIIGNLAENISFGKVLDEAADRLEEQENENEFLKNARVNLMKECANLRKQLSQQQPEWISVEDEPYPDLDCNVNMSWHLYPQDVPCYLVFQGNGSGDDGVTHWMRVEPPKPKEPTFKDVFLEKFPKVQIDERGIPRITCCTVFPYLNDGRNICQRFEYCYECWNQPYFEEGEADA